MTHTRSDLGRKGREEKEKRCQHVGIGLIYSAERHDQGGPKEGQLQMQEEHNEQYVAKGKTS